jgi:hypothetical protein
MFYKTSGFCVSWSVVKRSIISIKAQHRVPHIPWGAILLSSCQNNNKICSLALLGDSKVATPPPNWRTLSQQWVLIADSTEVQTVCFFFPWLPNCPIKVCLVLTWCWPDTSWCCAHTKFSSYYKHFGHVMYTRRHIMPLKCLLHTRCVHNRTSILVWASTILFSKWWIEPRAYKKKKEEAESTNKDPLLI